MPIELGVKCGQSYGSIQLLYVAQGQVAGSVNQVAEYASDIQVQDVVAVCVFLLHVRLHIQVDSIVLLLRGAQGPPNEISISPKRSTPCTPDFHLASEIRGTKLGRVEWKNVPYYRHVCMVRGHDARKLRARARARVADFFDELGSLLLLGDHLSASLHLALAAAVLTQLRIFDSLRRRR